MDAAKGNHTEHMRPTYNLMAKGIDKLKFNDLKVPLIANLDGMAHKDGAQIQSHLKEQVIIIIFLPSYQHL